MSEIDQMRLILGNYIGVPIHPLTYLSIIHFILLLQK